MFQCKLNILEVFKLSVNDLQLWLWSDMSPVIHMIYMVLSLNLILFFLLNDIRHLHVTDMRRKHNYFFNTEIHTSDRHDNGLVTRESNMDATFDHASDMHIFLSVTSYAYQ
jgi:hypothetical protein